MMCIRIPNMFFAMKPESSFNPRRPPEQLTDAEIRNKICEGRRGARGNCKDCSVSDICLYGKEAMKRGLV